MGLFSKSEPTIDSTLAAVTLTTGRDALRAIARCQSGILNAITAGEPILMVAADEVTSEHVVVAAGRRLLVFGKHGQSPQRVAEVTEIDRAAVNEGTAVCLEGLHLGYWIRFRSPAIANAVASTINKLILAYRPRTVPTLYPDYFLGILLAAKVPPTPGNVSRLIDRTIFMLGGQVAALCAQNHDPQTFDEFVRRYAMVSTFDDQLHVVDEMIDWLWARNPGLHYGIKRQINRWRDGVQQPGTFVTSKPGEVQPWEANPNGYAETWRRAYATAPNVGKSVTVVLQ